MGMAFSKQGVLQTLPAQKVLLSVAVALSGFIVACTSAPELRHPAGKSKQAVPGNQEAAARYEAQRLGVSLPQTPVVLSHDADDVKALSDQLEQLKQQIKQAKSFPALVGTNGNSSLPLRSQNKSLNRELPPVTQWPAPSAAPLTHEKDAPVWVSAARRFEVTAKDTTLLGVVVRWAQLNDWRVQLNGAALRAGAFPSHTTAYADIALLPIAKGLGADELDVALGALLEAHQHFKERLAFEVALKTTAQELVIQSKLTPAPPRSLAP
jgi:hypothetical protein